MAGTVRIEGFKELERALLALPEKVARKHAAASLRKAARPILTDARAKVPVNEGRLRKALKLRVDRLRESTAIGRVVSAMVYVSRGDGYRPRKSDRQSTVKGKLGPARYPYQIGSRPDVYGPWVEYGRAGQKPQPFLRPAFDGNVRRSIDILGDELGQRIAAEMKGSI